MIEAMTIPEKLNWEQQMLLIKRLTKANMVFMCRTQEPELKIIASTQPLDSDFGTGKNIKDSIILNKIKAGSQTHIIPISASNTIESSPFYLCPKNSSLVGSPIVVNRQIWGVIILIFNNVALQKRELINIVDAFNKTISDQLNKVQPVIKQENQFSNFHFVPQRVKNILKSTNTILSISDKHRNIVFHSHINANDIKEPCCKFFRGLNETCKECPNDYNNLSPSTFTHESKLGDKTYQVTTVPFKGDNNEIFLAEVRVDITARVKAEKKITELKELLEFSMNVGKIAFLEYNFKKDKIKTNDYFEKITGYHFKHSKVNLQWVLSRIHPEDSKRVKQIFFRRRNKLHDKLNFEFRLLNSKNKYLWLRYSGKITEIDANSYPSKISGIVNDITDLKAALSNLIVEQKKTIKTSQAKSLFMANISHEIRTPMNAILGFSDLLSSHVTKPPYNAFLDSIKSSGNLLLSLINDLLDFEKVQANKMLLKKEYIDFEMLIREIEQAFLMFANENENKIIIVKPNEFPSSIFIDAQKVKQILLNLVNNALKFTKKGSVTIEYSFHKYDDLQNGNFAFSIKDTGIGIRKEKQTEIFEPFTQDTQPYNETNQGTGLGLSIVQKLVEMMNGTITLDSSENKGSKFTILLPNIKSTENEIFNEVILDNELVILNKELVLIFGEEDSNMEVIKAHCKEMNLIYEIIHSKNHKPELMTTPRIIILNIYNNSDIEFVQNLKADANFNKIPMVGVIENKTYKNWLNEIEITDVIEIPINKEMLGHTLSKYINTPKASYKKVIYQKPNLKTEEKEKLRLYIKQNVIPIYKNLSERLSSSNLQRFSYELKNVSAIVDWINLNIYINHLEDGIQSYDFESIQNLLKNFAQLMKEID